MTANKSIPRPTLGTRGEWGAEGRFRRFRGERLGLNDDPWGRPGGARIKAGIVYPDRCRVLRFGEVIIL